MRKLMRWINASVVVAGLAVAGYLTACSAGDPGAGADPGAKGPVGEAVGALGGQGQGCILNWMAPPVCTGHLHCCTDSDTCTDLNTDVNNCGSCGRACRPNETCNVGVCTCDGVSCNDTATTQCCGNACISITDDMNCGACGNFCGNFTCKNSEGSCLQLSCTDAGVCANSNCAKMCGEDQGCSGC
jgi:hypothetical protein